MSVMKKYFLKGMQRLSCERIFSSCFHNVLFRSFPFCGIVLIDMHIYLITATGKVTTKVDVYAYGVILMEMITGRKVLDDSLPEDETHLVTIFRRNMLDKEKFKKFVDPTLELSAESWNSLLEVADLARHCSAREPYQRPDMCHCVNRLSSLVDQWKPTNIDDDDEGGTSEMGLHQQLERWRCDDFTISDSDSFSTYSLSRKYH
jgi:serine/threonine protein kinase